MGKLHEGAEGYDERAGELLPKDKTIRAGDLLDALALISNETVAIES